VPRVPDPKYSGSDLKIEFSDEVLEQMEADPEVAAMLRNFAASLRQAQQAVHDGKYETAEEALAALGLHAREIDLTEESDGDEG
jgi:hypothetical protein